MKKIYIAGCGGMLGEAFYMQFKEDHELKCTDIDVNEKWLSYLDFRDFNAYRQDVSAFKPDYLFHLGAFTDLEYCELHVEEKFRKGLRVVELACESEKERDIPLVYIRRDGIVECNKEF